MKNNNKLLIIQSCASFSQWIDIFLIFSLPVFIWQASAAQMAGVALLLAIPSVLISPWIGAWVDAHNPKSIMRFGAYLRLLLAVLLLLNPSMSVFFVLVFLRSIFSTLYWSAATVVTQGLISMPQRMAYFSSLSIFEQSAKVLSPLLVVGVSSLIGLQAGWSIAVLLNLVVVIMLHDPIFSTLKNDAQQHVTTPSRKQPISLSLMLQQLSGPLKLQMLFMLLLAFSLGLFDPHLALFMQSLGKAAADYSAVIVATALGAIFGALLLKTRFQNYTASALSGIGIYFYFAFILSLNLLMLNVEQIPLSILLMIWFVNGVGYELFMLGYSINMQNQCPSPILAKVSTSMRSLQLFIMLLATSIGAYLIQHYSFQHLYVISLGVVLLMVFILINMQLRLFRSM
ncbi:MFS transporter [Acinetobacter calcoaceticus]|uniref:MFS transporter n=1 Tax=Acinetobacter calcoaceticus TaxID=471 RepID=A0A4R1XB10_ACICA|nr:MFS transporter [Acinetobacter calcoaceticus]